MTAQKGFFSRVPADNAYAIEAVDPDPRTVSRQRFVSLLIVLAGMLLLLVVIAAIAFMCWKGVECESCDVKVTDADAMPMISRPEYVEDSWPSDDFQTSASEYSKSTPHPIVTTIKIETNDPDPPHSHIPTPSRKNDSDDHLPWYARLPLIGWLFRTSETTDQIVAKITIM